MNTITIDRAVSEQEDSLEDLLREWLSYDHATGIFTWNKMTKNRKFKQGDVAGSMDNDGHIKIQLNGRMYWAHRLAFLYMTGEMPANSVDHINRVKNDNRWDNLRQATAFENQWNTNIRKDNTSGTKGVYFCSTWKKWIAACRVRGKRHYLGRFDIKDDAINAITKFRNSHHGIYAS